MFTRGAHQRQLAACKTLANISRFYGRESSIRRATGPGKSLELQESNLRLRRHHVLHEDGDVAELVARDAVVVAELDRDHIRIVAAVPVNL